MKLSMFFVLSCLSFVCIVSAETVTDYGRVSGPIMATENVIVDFTPLRVKEFTFTYPRQQEFTPVLIAGFKHIDYKSHPIKVEIMAGDLDPHQVALRLTSPRGHGINSTFIFYTYEDEYHRP